MKSRLSYFLISGIIIFLVITGAFIWRNQHLKEWPKFNEKSFTAPISSKYVPINADLVFHWKINPSELPEYIGNFQDRVNKNITIEQVKLIRDSFFQLNSLDFTKDISNWSGGYGSFAIFETNKQLLDNWLMVLETKKDTNIEEELESISGSEIIDKDINSNIYKSKLFSKRINANQSIYYLIDQEHILISSNPKIIESSINNLKKNLLSPRDKHKTMLLKDKLNDGILLLEISPKKIFNLIGQGEYLLGIDEADKLISSIYIEDKELILEGILAYDIKSKRQIEELPHNLINIEKEVNTFNNFILIDNPKKYFLKDLNHPYQKLIISFFNQATKGDDSHLSKLILKNTKGSLIWLKNNHWLIINRKRDADKQEINDSLQNENFLNSKLELENKNLDVWSKITTTNNEKYEIKENIEAILEDNEDTYIWSQDITTILNLENKKYFPNHIYTEYSENEHNDFDDLIRIHLGEEETTVFLNSFYPYLLLRTILGNKLDFPKNIDISLAVPTINYPDFIKYKIKLKTS